MLREPPAAKPTSLTQPPRRDLIVRWPGWTTALTAGLLLLIIAYNLIWSFPSAQFVPDRLGPVSAPLRQVFERLATRRELPLRDFGSFVAAGQLAATGRDPYGDHPLVFRPIFHGTDGVATASPNLNPPLSIVAFQWLASVNPTTAYKLWYIASLGLYCVALAVLWRLFPDTATPLRLLWALALAGLWHVLELGQIYVPLLLATLGGWLLLRQGRQVAAGLLIGLVVAVKPNFALWPLFLLLSGGWLAGVTALMAAAGLSLVPVLVYGPGIYAQWLAATATVTEMLLTVPGNSSLIGLAARLGVSWLGWLVAGALIITAAIWVWWRRPPLLVTSLLALIVAMLAAPLAWAGYTLLLVPALLSQPWRPATRVAAALLVVPFLIVMQVSALGPLLNVVVGGFYIWPLLILLGVVWWERQGTPRLTPVVTA